LRMSFSVRSRLVSTRRSSFSDVGNESKHIQPVRSGTSAATPIAAGVVALLKGGESQGDDTENNAKSHRILANCQGVKDSCRRRTKHAEMAPADCLYGNAGQFPEAGRTANSGSQPWHRSGACDAGSPKLLAQAGSRGRPKYARSITCTAKAMNQRPAI